MEVETGFMSLVIMDYVIITVRNLRYFEEEREMRCQNSFVEEQAVSNST